MNKRDFLVHSGGLVLTTTAISAPLGMGSRPAQAASAQAHWEALQGQVFACQTRLGRPIELTLSAVHTGAHHARLSRQAQFTVSFEGPRGRPLQEGIYALQHPQAGTTALHLTPVAHGELITYDAHFNLLS